MATKPQAKAAIDAAVVRIKADIDNRLPAGVNIIDGAINFGPISWRFVLDAEGSSIKAEQLLTDITASLATNSVLFSVERFGRRRDDGSGKIIRIDTAEVSYLIKNF